MNRDQYLQKRNWHHDKSAAAMPQGGSAVRGTGTRNAGLRAAAAADDESARHQA